MGMKEVMSVHWHVSNTTVEWGKTCTTRMGLTLEACVGQAVEPRGKEGHDSLGLWADFMGKTFTVMEILSSFVEKILLSADD